MSRIPSMFGMLALLAAFLWVGLSASQSTPLPSTGLVGTIKSHDGKPLEGVAVSARANKKSFTTSVYTDQAGEYYFPSLEDGQYRIWAQAVGFELARSEQAVSSGKKIQQDFTLNAFSDFHKQLSDAEWVDSLPDGTADDRRMKKVLLNVCSPCHRTGFVLEKRFDSAGWELIVNSMINEVRRFTEFAGGKGPELDETGEPIGPPRRLMEFYKKDIVAYLTRVRGPTPYPLKLKPYPRPTGEAAAIVVTEYDIPRNDESDQYGNYDYRNGSDWSRGIRAIEDVTHDAVLSTDGNIYFTDGDTPGRTIGRLDPRTGLVASFKAPGMGKETGFAAGTEFASADKNGTIWLTSPSSGMLLKFDPKTENFQRFPKPSSIGALHGAPVVDSKGNAWVSQYNGAVRLDPATGEFTEFKSITKVGRPYDLVLDPEDKAWFTMIAVDRMGVVDGRTGQVSEVALPPLDEELSSRDREIGQRSGGWTSTAPLYQKGPRRLGADPNGNTVWVGEYWAGRLAKIDIHTKKVTEYKLPYRYSYPYKIAVDRDHMAWFGMANADRIGKFNPVTEQFTMYQLPTRGSIALHLSVDNSTEMPTIWVPYAGANKIARVQFRRVSAH